MKVILVVNNSKKKEQPPLPSNHARTHTHTYTHAHTAKQWYSKVYMHTDWCPLIDYRLAGSHSSTF